MGIYEELQARGLIAQVTDEPLIRDLVNNGKATFYIGFDPTADSLHVGHFMALCLMKRLQEAGNKPIALIGGGTAMIGDPSGRTDMRQMMTPETIQHNCDCFKKQMSRFIDFSDGKALMVNNADWLMDLNYVEVLREVGAHFSVNRMLTAECYKQRMEKGLSFLEFNYMIMQSYDFYMLYQKYGCNLQFGGNDQWSNMLGGTELIRRKLDKDASAMTITLLLNSEGKKMGKTASGAVWLDPDKTSPYDFYQYWRNVDDADVLTDEEEKNLEALIAEKEELIGGDLVLITTNDASLDTMEKLRDYAQNYYKENKLGWDQPIGSGAIYVDDWETRYTWLATRGRVKDRLSKDNTDYIVDETNDIVNKDPYKAYTRLINLIAEETQKSPMFHINISPIWVLLGCLVVSLIFVVAQLSGQVGKDTVKKSTYVKKDGVQMNDKKDVFLHSHVTKTKRKSDDDSGSSCSGTDDFGGSGGSH